MIRKDKNEKQTEIHFVKIDFKNKAFRQNIINKKRQRPPLRYRQDISILLEITKGNYT